MKKSESIKTVAIIMGFYNGKKFIFEQLNSIISQSYKEFKIFIFDDQSNEKITQSELISYKENFSKISIIERKSNFGYANNFLQGLKDVGSGFDYYAFSDQDDIWEKNKLEIGLKKIQELNSQNSVLYCSRTSYFDNDSMNEIGSSRNFTKLPEFKNALIQNIAGGNTILINNKARNLIVNSLISDKFISHDWWCYLLISAAGGNIIFDTTKTLRYRQHGGNLIGGNHKLKDRIIRFKRFFLGNFKEWTDVNISNLLKNKNLIKKENLRTLQKFIDARNSNNIFHKIILYKNSGVFRQSFLENLIFIIGVILNKI